MIYIGEGDDISLRIKSHDIKKDWWTGVVLITTTGGRLHKAHAQYIEARLIEVARRVGRVRLENAAVPGLPTLNEAARANMEGFLENLFLVLPAVGVDIFVENARPATTSSAVDAANSSEPTFELTSERHALKATARLKDGEFIVEAGSLARGNWEGTPDYPYKRLYDRLVSIGVLEQVGTHRRFSTDYVFKSPSAAAAVMYGRGANGHEAWKIKGTETTYRAWEALQVASADSR